MLHLDTTHDEYLVDDKGNIRTNMDGTKVRVAVDHVSGDRYVKIADHLPKVEDHTDVRDRLDAKHFTSDHPGMTGWWAPEKKVYSAKK